MGKDRHYEARKAEHRCVRCGEPLPDGWNRVLCETCNAANNDYINWLHRKRRELGLCRDCGKPSYQGSARCYECIVKTSKYHRKKASK